jgi:hypothetical protein
MIQSALIGLGITIIIYTVIALLGVLITFINDLTDLNLVPSVNNIHEYFINGLILLVYLCILFFALFVTMIIGEFILSIFS